MCGVPCSVSSSQTMPVRIRSIEPSVGSTATSDQKQFLVHEIHRYTSPAMSPHRRHRWIVWLLPLFILRAFVPAGFMLHLSSEGLQVVLCTGAGPAQAGQWNAGVGMQHHAASGHEDHAQSHAGSHGHQEGSPGAASHESSLCPFAAVGSGFIDALAQCAPGPVSVTAQIVSLPARQLLTRDPISLHRIRGPPTLLA